MIGEELNFVKYSAHGNDFLIFDNLDGQIRTDDISYWQKICARRTGVGADGVLFVEKSQKYDFHMRYLNADGSEESMCGNGARAISHFYAELIDRDIVTLEFSTSAGVYHSKVNDFYVEVEMTEFYDENLFDISNYFKAMDTYYVNTGVPHCVFEVDDVNAVDVEKEGARIRHMKLFKNGANVNFISRDDSSNKYLIRTYERGVEGETLSCGTGITACAYMLFKKTLSDELKFLSRGGELIVSRREGKVFYGGQVDLIYKGRLCIK